MAKTRLNGSLKWILGSIAIATFAITVGTFLVKGSWRASNIASAVEQNCAEDKRVHSIAEQSKDAIIKMESTVAQTQKDVAQIVKGQETIEKKLDDLFMMQLVGPGSTPTR